MTQNFTMQEYDTSNDILVITQIVKNIYIEEDKGKKRKKRLIRSKVLSLEKTLILTLS